jgi:integrase
MKWLPLGSYPDMSLEDLRVAAAGAQRQKKDGKDPRHEAEQERKRQAEVTKKAKTAPTMKDACDLYRTYAADRTNVKESTEKWATAVIDRLIADHWGDRLVSEVTKKEVATWHKSPAMRETPSQADAALRVISKIFNLAIEEDWRTDNPAHRLPKLVRGAAKVRVRILNKPERRALERTIKKLEAEQAIESAAAGAIRVLLLSAMRKEEVLTLRWDEITWDLPIWDEEKKEEIDPLTGWIRKGEHKSNRRTGVKLVAVTPQLGKILKGQPTREGSPWVFPSPRTPPPDEEVGHFVGLQKIWERLLKRVTKDEQELVKAKKKKESEAINIEDVHLHDLRRTALSITYGNAGQSIEALSEIAGHASTATTEKIFAHLEREKLRAAAERIAKEIAADMEEE